MNTDTMAFFDLHLRGRPSPLLRGALPAYPEVALQARSGSEPAAQTGPGR